MTTILQAQLGLEMHSHQSSSLSRLSHSDYYDDEDGLEPEPGHSLVLAEVPDQLELDHDMDQLEQDEEDGDVLTDDEGEAELVDDVECLGEQLMSSDHSSEDEMAAKPQAEQDSIKYEIQQLLDSIPALLDQYKLVDRLGEGTFSSVYKAIDLQHGDYDNSLWASASSGARGGKVYVALKRIYVTSSPIRIQNELEILNDLRGEANVAYLIAALRHEDQVIAVMPFNRHQDFRSYYRTSTLPLLRSYFACLFRALDSTHKQHIIHRDVKPANFLYDTLTGIGTLCDYGLAQKIGGDDWFEWKGECCHSLPGPAWLNPDDRARSLRRMERLTAGTAPGLVSGLHGVRMGRPVGVYEQASKMETEWRELVNELNDDSEMADVDWVTQLKPWIMPSDIRSELKARSRDKASWYKHWRPSPGALNAAPKERVGYLKDDRRPSVRANRAGTRGFRAPEVLLKCADQTVSLDIWSAGIILLCFLTRRFPFFNSNDDTEALAEIAAIFGKRKVERCAALHNRTLYTNIPTFDNPAHPTLHHLVKALNPTIVVENSPDPFGPIPSTSASDQSWYQDSDIYQCVDLMKMCLQMDCTKRWTAKECLNHPFFTQDGVLFDYGGGNLGPRDDRYT